MDKKTEKPKYPAIILYVKNTLLAAKSVGLYGTIKEAEVVGDKVRVTYEMPISRLIKPISGEKVDKFKITDDGVEMHIVKEK